MTGDSDITVVRTAGLVLLWIGALGVALALAWNARGERPAPDDLVSIRGRVVAHEVKTISSRTSIDKWVVIDVAQAGEPQRWVFPEFARSLADALAQIPVGAEVGARAVADPQRLRWNETPVRIIWSLSVGERELVGYDQVAQVFDASRRQSPAAGWITMALGALLWGASRWGGRRGQGLQTSS